MARTVTLDWNTFMCGESTQNKRNYAVLAKTALGAHILLIPQRTLAATGGDATWTEIFSTVLNIADWLCVGVFVFAGTTWMFGNRTKALDLILGGSVGYLIIRHAEDIRDWLKTL